MKRSFTCILVILFCVAATWANEREEAIKVAHAGFKDFINGPLAQKQFRKGHGLLETDQVEQATLGEPLILYSLPPDNIRNYENGTAIHQCAVKTGIYLFPVLFDGAAKLFMEVSTYGTDHLQIGMLGNSWLAEEISSITDQYPATEGYSIMLIQNYQTHRYMFHVPGNGKDNLTIIDPRISKQQGYAALSSAEKTIAQLRKELEVFMGE